MIRISLLVAFILCNSMPGVTLASPTSNEFLPCHQIAAEVLQRCLDRQPGYKNEACWRESRRNCRDCYAQVAARHAPDANKERGARMRELEMQRKKTAADVKSVQSGS